MPRILMVAYTNYLTDARPRRAAEALTSRGDEVDFISLAEQGRPAAEQLNGVTVLRLSQGRYRGSSGLRYLWSYGLFFVRVSAMVVRRMMSRHYDVVYVHTMPDWMVFVGLIPKLFGAKIVLDMHDMMPELYMSKFGLNEKHLLIRFMKFQERLSFGLADRIICVHEPHRDVLVRRGARIGKLTVILNLPDPSIFGERSAMAERPAGGGGLRLVYHGTIVKRLGLDVALKAFREVVGQCPGAHFDIYGDGDDAERVDALIREYGLSNHVYFSRKFFRVDEIPALIRGATMGIISNRRDIATEYMLPVKMIEYLYLDIPVVAPRLGAISHYFSDDAVAYYAPGDSAELARTILELYRDESKRASFRRNAQKFMSLYSWSEMKKELYAAIDN